MARSCHSRPRTRETSAGNRSSRRAVSRRCCSATPPITKMVDAGRWALVGRKLVEAVRRHLGVLEETELVLELRQLPRVTTGATLVELGTELE
jgi:hypothetical protein